ncbi:MAG TPA: hypothetical protein VM261_22845 [Kofleriaceae bacterium]|nr:hypothetical protein [Kofleriaceae bacterium]
MMRIALALVLAVVATGCVIADDESPIDAPEFSGADCGCGFDRPLDSPDPANPCDACGAGTICVQLLNGTCGSHAVECKPVVTGCEQATCSPACDDAYCDRQISTCSAGGCEADIPGAFHCYGV